MIMVSHLIVSKILSTISWKLTPMNAATRLLARMFKCSDCSIRHDANDISHVTSTVCDVTFF